MGKVNTPLIYIENLLNEHKELKTSRAISEAIKYSLTGKYGLYDKVSVLGNNIIRFSCKRKETTKDKCFVRVQSNVYPQFISKFKSELKDEQEKMREKNEKYALIIVAREISPMGLETLAFYFMDGIFWDYKRQLWYRVCNKYVPKQPPKIYGTKETKRIRTVPTR